MKFLFKVTFTIVLASLILSAQNKIREFNNEPYRPQIHFTPEKNWMNDPNGLVYYDGEYHLFYQYNPDGIDWGNMHWGHAVSKDLVHWEYLPIALYPDGNSEDNDRGDAWSGCGLVDHNNICGFQKDSVKTILLFYTSYQCGQCLAYSTDKGRTWNKYKKNPLIPYDEQDDARDPKVFWHEASKKYVMALYRKPGGEALNKGVSFYTSSNLFDWKFKSHIPGFYECPDLVELPVNRRQDEKKWVLFDGDGSYMIGSFDGEKFTPESSKQKSDFGKNYYATQTWSNIPANDGRIIQIAWMKGAEFPNMPFKGQMTFPCELSLEKYKEGIILVRKPVKEIELLYLKQNTWKEKNIIPGLNKNLTGRIKGDCLHIIGTFDIKTSDNFGFILRGNKMNQGSELSFNTKKNILSCLGQQAVIEPVDGKIQLEILLDRSSIEVFANGGKLAMSSCFSPVENDKNLVFFTSGGELYVEKLDVFTLNSIWGPEEK
jgi:fructan beta-fructosidase